VTGESGHLCQKLRLVSAASLLFKVATESKLKTVNVVVPEGTGEPESRALERLKKVVPGVELVLITRGGVL